MDEVLREMADGAGLEFTGGAKPIPQPQVLTDELGNLSLTWEEDRIQIQINAISRGGYALNCILSVREMNGKAARWLSAPVRINLFSDSAKTGLRRTLNERRGLDWATRLDQVVVAVHHAADDLRSVGILQPRQSVSGRNWLLSPVAERNQHSMLVASGGTGKSLLALGLFASVATGREIVPGLVPQDFQGNCLYLDWETDQETHELRLTQMCAGAGVEFPKDRIHYIRMAVPLAEDVPYLYQYIIKNRIKFVVGDSVGMATAGDINSQSDAITYVNAVRALGDVTYLSIHHVGWGEQGRSTGSRYFENAARSVWVLEKDQDAAVSDSHVDLVHRKSNNGILEPSMGIRVEFGDAIRYYRDVVSEDKRRPVDLVEEVLSAGWIDLQAIYTELDTLEKGTIRQALLRMTRRGDAIKRDTDNRKNPEYALSVTRNNRNGYVTGGGTVTHPLPLRGERGDVTNSTAESGYTENEDQEKKPQGWWMEDSDESFG